MKSHPQGQSSWLQSRLDQRGSLNIPASVKSSMDLAPHVDVILREHNGVLVIAHRNSVPNDIVWTNPALDTWAIHRFQGPEHPLSASLTTGAPLRGPGLPPTASSGPKYAWTVVAGKGGALTIPKAARSYLGGMSEGSVFRAEFRSDHTGEWLCFRVPTETDPDEINAMRAEVSSEVEKQVAEKMEYAARAIQQLQAALAAKTEELERLRRERISAERDSSLRISTERDSSLRISTERDSSLRISPVSGLRESPAERDTAVSGSPLAKPPAFPQWGKPPESAVPLPDTRFTIGQRGPSSTDANPTKMVWTELGTWAEVADLDAGE